MVKRDATHTRNTRQQAFWVYLQANPKQCSSYVRSSHFLRDYILYKRLTRYLMYWIQKNTMPLFQCLFVCLLYHPNRRHFKNHVFYIQNIFSTFVRFDHVATTLQTQIFYRTNIIFHSFLPFLLTPYFFLSLLSKFLLVFLSFTVTARALTWFCALDVPTPHPIHRGSLVGWKAGMKSRSERNLLKL